MNANAGLALMIVAGGGSRRMGSDKASRLVSGRPALEHVLHQASTLDLIATVVVAREGQVLPTLPPGVERVDDPPERQGEGPLPALATGLDALRDRTVDAVLVLATDAIGVRGADLRRLVAALEGHEAAVPRSDGRWHPLTAVYALRPLQRALRALLEAGERRLQALPEALRVAQMGPETMSATALMACNTPERWRQVEAAISDGAGGRDRPG